MAPNTSLMLCRFNYKNRGTPMLQYSKFKTFIIVLMSILLTTGCVVESITSSGGSENGSDGGTGGVDQGDFDYDGCVDGQGVGTKSIQVNFLFPTEASSVRIKRNGNQIAQFSSSNETTSHIDDAGLREGATYLYTCEALIDGLWSEGRVSLQLSTLAENAPVFSGIDAAVAVDANTVKASWIPSIQDDPVPTYSYQIYANVGDTVNWTIAPKGTVLQGSPAEFDVPDLGDELSYAFGVRACSEGDVCETNMNQILVMTPDGGPPTTPGVSAVNIQNAKIQVTAPWVETNGGVKKRLIYVRRGATGGTNIGDYNLERTYTLNGAALYSPPQNLEIVNLVEGQTYHVIVQDEDPSGQRSAVTNFETITVGDITPPSFGGITNIFAASPADSVLNITWNTIATEAVDPVNGGSVYKVYRLTDTTPISSNACALGQEIATLNVADYTAGTTANYDITGLQERAYHRICIKAVDSIGNVSTNDNSLQRNTLDITPPDFSGIESLSFDNQASTLDLSWNSSTSEDILDYRVSLWTNQPTPPPSPIVLFKSHDLNTTGTSLDSSEFTINDNDEVYVNVEACDKTESPFGVKNCTSIGSQRSVTVPDVTPPPNFAGIKGPTDLETPVEGSVIVKWNAPADWSDYRGFRVYSVDTAMNSITLLKTQPCVDYGCSDQITQTQVDGLTPYRTYRFHVRAYDESNNETLYLNPNTSFADKRTSDTTAPSFASNLTIGVSPDFTLSWNPAVDNQHAPEPGAVITYRVYQNNAPFDFTDPTQPDGNLKTARNTTTFTDNGFIESQTYYYTVCAVDASGNTFCDQLTRSFTVPDVTDPVITNFQTDKSVKAKVWELSWEMSDNISDNENLSVVIRRRVSVNGDLATTSDPVVYSGQGSEVIVSGNEASTAQTTSLDPLSGVADLDRQINYLLTVTDEEGNVASANLSLKSTNSITVESASPEIGPTTGGQTVTIYGTGFSKATENGVGVDTTVTIAGKPCTDVNIISEKALFCTAPSASVGGGVEIRVRTQINSPAIATNRQYSENFLTNGYTFSVSPVLCDNPGVWNADFAAGVGTEADPYIICDIDHLDNIKDISDSGSYYKLGQSIDLAGETFTPIGNATKKFTGGFDGDGKIILNWTYNQPQTTIGFFGQVNGDFQIKDIGLVNVDITAQQSIGALIGVVEGGVNKNAAISNVFASGTITATDGFVGGLIGRKQGEHINFNMINSYYVGTINANGSTGYGGGIIGFLGQDAGGFFQDIFSEGNINGTKALGGLFGNLGEGKQLINSFSRATVKASGNVAGGLAGEVKPGASISDSFVESGVISGVDAVGGLVGQLEGSLSNSDSRVSVVSTGRRAGGAVGYATVATMNSVTSTKDHTFNNVAGGLVGEMRSSVLTNSSASGTHVATGNEIGGLVGKVFIGSALTSTFSESNAEGLLDTTSSTVGGLIGTIESLSNGTLDLSEVFATTQVGTDFALPTQQYGGLIGKINTQSGSQINISDCYASGEVYGGSQSGGLLGGYDFTGGSVDIQRCYSASPVYGGSNGRGGLFGRTNNTLITANNTYWDRNVTLQDFATNNGSYNGVVTGYTTAQMQDYSNSVYVGWDFLNTWKEPADPGYPLLRFVD